jgi:YHS domain-containing protein
VAQVLVDEAEGDLLQGGMVTDPGCGMAVEPAGNPTATLGGRTWWFCSTHCREEFTADPARFTGRQGEPVDATGQGQIGTLGPDPHRPVSRR